MKVYTDTTVMNIIFCHFVNFHKNCICLDISMIRVRMTECSLRLYQNTLFKDVLASALKMDSLCGGLLCAVSTSSQ